MCRCLTGNYLTFLALATGLGAFFGFALGAAFFTAAFLGMAFFAKGLGFAAGAMLFVISNEILPESHREGQGLADTVGVVFGFLLMMILDTAFA